MVEITEHQKMRLSRKWWALTLARQYLIASCVVLVAGMVTIGTWVSSKIEEGVIENTATATALYMDSFVAPWLQELAAESRLSERSQSALSGLLRDTELGKRVVSFKVWKEGGLIAFSSRPEIIGKTFPQTENLKSAWNGSVAADLDELSDEEDALERAVKIPLLEIYSPIRESNTGRIIAVAEFYEHAHHLEQDLRNAQSQTWLVVATVTAVMLGLLFTIVRRGSQTITQQESAIRGQFSELSELSELRNRLHSASGKSTELTEQYLRRTSADLHDGPAQLLGLSLLTLDSLGAVLSSDPEKSARGRQNIELVKGALEDAFREIRSISAGLALPELDGLQLPEIMETAISAHESRTGLKVVRQIKGGQYDTSKSVGICVYRFVQEGLNNIHKHADSKHATVYAHCEDEAVIVSVSDDGLGFSPGSGRADPHVSGLGLPGIRERIESLGGEFELQTAPGAGTCITARFSAAGTGR